MKKYIFSVFVLVLLTSVSAFANKDSKFIDKAKANYLHIMDKDIGPSVESAIFNVMELKQRYPDHDYRVVIRKLDQLSRSSDIPAVRYKAFLALNYFNNFEWFGAYQFDGQNPNQVFSEISKKMDINNKISFINGN